MNLETTFLIYAGLFRLAIITAGVIIIVLGYWLFAKGVFNERGTEVSASAGGVQFTLKNAAPGTCFSLFGAAIIIFMLMQGIPSLTVQELKKMQGGDEQTEESSKTVLKGGEVPVSDQTSQAYESLLSEGMRRMSKEDNSGALTAFQRALANPELTLKQAVPAFNQIAWIYQGQDEPDKALPLIELALGIEPRNAMFLDTLANVLLKQKKLDHALYAAQQAIRLKPNVAAHLHTLALVYRAKGDHRNALEQMEKTARLDNKYQDELIELRSKVH